MITKEDCFELGYIQKTHNLKGDLIAILDVDDPFFYKSLKQVYIEMSNQLVPFAIEKMDVRDQFSYLKLDDINDVDEAQAFINCTLYLPLQQLPPLEEGEFYLHQIINYTVVDIHKGPLGLVSNIYDNTNQTLIAMLYQGVEVLIPLVEEIVLQVIDESKTLEVDLPEGLIELYLDENQK